MCPKLLSGKGAMKGDAVFHQLRKCNDGRKDAEREMIFSHSLESY